MKRILRFFGFKKKYLTQHQKLEQILAEYKKIYQQQQQKMLKFYMHHELSRINFDRANAYANKMQETFQQIQQLQNKLQPKMIIDPKEFFYLN